MPSIPCFSSWLDSDCCRTSCGAACEGQRIIATSPNVLVTALSLLRQCKRRGVAYGFTLLRWEKCKEYIPLLPACRPACLNCLLCSRCLRRPANKSLSV